MSRPRMFSREHERKMADAAHALQLELDAAQLRAMMARAHVKAPRRVSTATILGAVGKETAKLNVGLLRDLHLVVEHLAALKPAKHSWFGKAPADPVMIAAEMVERMSARISLHLTKAGQIGRNLALRVVAGHPRLSDEAAEDLVNTSIARQTEFLKSSFAPDLLAKFHEASDAGAVQELADAMESRISMYAASTWGTASTVFGETVQSEGAPVWWVLTSASPCADCPGLAESSPYDTNNPLPTHPGAGDTECRSNCLCLLEVSPREDDGKATVPRSRSTAALDVDDLDDEAARPCGDWSDADLALAADIVGGDATDMPTGPDGPENAR